MIDRAASIGPASIPRPAGPPAAAPAAPGAPRFDDLLQRANSRFTLSGHAQKRLDHRALDLDAPKLQRLDAAIDRAASKGARSTVVVLDNLAVIVDIPGRTVVTALDTTRGKENVFTNIDSVVIA
jgi:flagellar operon protein